jgi:hypothetical protein
MELPLEHEGFFGPQKVKVELFEGKLCWEVWQMMDSGFVEDMLSDEEMQVSPDELPLKVKEVIDYCDSVRSVGGLNG